MQTSTATNMVLEAEDSGDESDGTSALKRVKDQEDTAGSRRGPTNSSMKHFHEPIPTVEQKSGAKRWEFQCRYCTWCVAISWPFQRSNPRLKSHTIPSSVRTFTRTIEGDNITFDDEPILPKLNNLATHYNECKKKDDSMKVEEDQEPLSAQMNLKRSAELMAEYLKAGDLNPAVIPTQAGFLRLFSAWILDESLPWTTGEAPALQALFQYLKVKFILPTDTTVRNQLAKIFAELHAKVVHEFTVRNYYLQ